MDFYTLFAQVVSISTRYLNLLSVLIFSLFLLSCEGKSAQELDRKKEANVVLHTDLGSIYVKLLDETPRHKANFLRLAKRGFFDKLSFHRIIREFMIQSGDPRYSNGGIDTSQLSGPGYSLDNEFREDLFHTRGMIGAAREPDEENPERKSAGSQFYIVTGKPVSPAVLDTFELVGTAFRKGNFYTRFNEEREAGSYTGTFPDYLTQKGFKPFKYPVGVQQRYLQEGGTPHLDFSYTIFGEVVEGMDIAMKISDIPTSSYQVPKDTIRILSTEILKE